MLPAGRRVAGKPRLARVPLSLDPRVPRASQPAPPHFVPASSLRAQAPVARIGATFGKAARRWGERKGAPGGGRRVRGEAPPLPAAQLEQDLRGRHRPGSAPAAAGGGEEGSLWGWVWSGWGGGSFLRLTAGSQSGRGGETVGGRPGRGWRRRCRRRRRNRRGGCRCRSCRRRHCLLLRQRRGASKRKRLRGARRTPQLDPSLQLQASAPPLPSQSLNQSSRSAGPEPRAYWSAAVAVRAGAPGETTTAGIRFPSQIPGPPLSPPLAPGSAPEGWSQSDGCPDRTHFPIGR